MTITVEKLPGEPIVIATYQEPIDWQKEIPEMFEQILVLRDTFEGCPKYYAILDLRAIKIGFSEMVLTMGEARKAGKKRRPDMPVSPSLIGSGPIIRLASKAMEQQQYGEYRVALYTSLDKALDMIRAEIATWQSAS